MKKILLNHSLSLAIGSLLMAGAAPTVGAETLTPDFCLPTCNTNDAKTLVLAGERLQTLADDSIYFDFTVPEGTTSFNLAIFDGNANGQWDNFAEGVQSTEFILYADPDVDLDPGHLHTNQIKIAEWPSTGMADNDWWKHTITTNPLFQSADGNFHYRLEVKNADQIKVKNANNFKVAVGEGFDTTQLPKQPKTVSLSLEPQPVAFMGSYWGSWNKQGDQASSDKELDTIYPPGLNGGTTYDGKFTLSFRVPEGATSVVIHDGDLDFGELNLNNVNDAGVVYSANPDTDDPDTPNEVPAWASSALAEGIAKAFPDPPINPIDLNNPNNAYNKYAKVTGNPADDSNLSLYQRSPNIRYKVCDPNNVCYYNANPSGNREWEQFKLIKLNPGEQFDRTTADYPVTSIPAGIWTIHMEGVDLTNLNAYRVGYDTVGQPPCANYPNCDPFEEITVTLGDTIWFDVNQDGIQNNGEMGLAGVSVTLINGFKEKIGATTTDASGFYSFNVVQGTYKVVVDAANFETGGPLSGFIPTVDYTNDGKGDNEREQVVNVNTPTYDFGYYGKWECDLTKAQTLTQGGWSNKAHADLLNTLYSNPGFSVKIGVPSRSVTLTSAVAVQKFLPSGGTPTWLASGDAVYSTAANTVNIKNTLAGQTVTAILNFSQWSSLGGAVLTNGPYKGKTILEVIGLANQALGKGATTLTGSYSDLTAALDSVNRNLDDGKVNLGNLACPSR